MTRDETKKIVAIITATYPNWHPQDLSFTVDAWTTMLEDFSYSQVSAALKAFILSDTSGFAPSVGQLVGLMERVGGNQRLSETEAWSLVSLALRDGAYHSEERFSELPELVQRAVGSASQLHAWAIDSAFNENVAASNFMRVYRTVVERERELQKIPAAVRALIAGVEVRGIEAHG